MWGEGSLEEGLPGSRDRSSYPDGKSEDDEDENGEKSSLVLLSQISLNNSSDLTCLEAFYDAIMRECLFSDDTAREYSLIRKDWCVEDWYADTVRDMAVVSTGCCSVI